MDSYRVRDLRIIHWRYGKPFCAQCTRCERTFTLNDPSIVDLEKNAARTLRPNSEITGVWNLQHFAKSPESTWLRRRAAGFSPLYNEPMDKEFEKSLQELLRKSQGLIRQSEALVNGSKVLAEQSKALIEKFQSDEKRLPKTPRKKLGKT